MFIGENVTIGNNVKIQNNVSVYSGVTCEDDVFIGPSVVFTNVKNPRSKVSRNQQYSETKIKRGTSIGANATIVCGITIGEFAFIGAGSVVTKNIPSYALVVGNPGRLKGWMSEAGIKLNFDPVTNEAICSHSGEKYILNNQQVFKITNDYLR